MHTDECFTQKAEKATEISGGSELGLEARSTNSQQRIRGSSFALDSPRKVQYDSRVAIEIPTNVAIAFSPLKNSPAGQHIVHHAVASRSPHPSAHWSRTSSSTASPPAASSFGDVATASHT